MKIQAIPMKNGWTCVRLSEEEKDYRVPVHLCCVIDTSGSMRDDSKIIYVKQSLQIILDSMGAEDWLSIITFDLQIQTLVKQILCKAEHKESIRQKIHWIQAQGGTNLCEGLLEATNCLLPFDSSRKQGIMLLTDGEATHGHVTTSAILTVVNDTLNLDGTTVSCIGYGTNHNVDLLRRLSEKYAGSYYVVQHASDVPIVFGDIMGGLLSTCSQRIHIEVDQIENPSSIQSVYPVTRTFQHRSVYVGDLPSGKEAAIMIKAPEGAPFTVSYQPIGQEMIHHHGSIPSVAAVAACSDDEKMLSEVHHMRYDVIALMSTVVDQTKSHLTDSKKIEYLDQINGYKERITGLKAMFEHPHWNLILDELDHLRMYIAEPERCCVDFQQVLIQRMGCLAMLRGVGASASNQYHGDIPPALRISPSLSTAYSNSTQQIYSMNYTQSFQMGENEHDSYAPPPPELPHLSLSPAASLPRFQIPGAAASSSSLLLFNSFQEIDPFEVDKEEENNEDESQPGM